MRLALTGGGTGGHIFPALAVLEAVRAESSTPIEVCFFGPENRGERSLVESAGVPFEGVPSAGLRGRGPLGLIKSAWALLSGVVTAVRKLRRFKPDVVFSTGAMAASPAAWPPASSAVRSSSTCQMSTRAGPSRPNACSPRG
ncbi:MAG: glycosyltransferase [Dehalococcoidia bacterium]|nr:glycosyltransferase [Dehalococcoidia bacterium]